MTDNVIPFPSKKDVDAREVYHVVFSHDIPMPSTMTIAARSREHAIELAKDQLKHHRNVEILDTYKIKDAPEMEQMMEEWLAARDPEPIQELENQDPKKVN